MIAVRCSVVLSLAAALALVGLSAKPATAQPAPTPAPTLALVGETLIDGFGGVPLRNSVVLVAGEDIVAVG